MDGKRVLEQVAISQQSASIGRAKPTTFKVAAEIPFLLKPETMKSVLLPSQIVIQ
jgi:hypothetical protein